MLDCSLTKTLQAIITFQTEVWGPLKHSLFPATTHQKKEELYVVATDVLVYNKCLRVKERERLDKESGDKEEKDLLNWKMLWSDTLWEHIVGHPLLSEN